MDIMYYSIPILLASLNICAGGSVINLCIDYFKYRDVTNICLLNCDLYNSWSAKLARNASLQFISLSSVNINLIKNCENLQPCLLQQRFSSVGVILDWSCEKSKETLYYASENMMLDAVHKWIIVDDSRNDCNGFNKPRIELNENKLYDNNTNSGIFEDLADLNISVDADIMVATSKSSSEYLLQEVFNYGRIQGGSLIVNKVGVWNDKLGLDLNIKGFKYYRRWNFHKWSMRMIAVVSPTPDKFDPKILTDRSPSPNVATITKTSATIIHEVAEIHNFRFIYAITDRWISDFNKNSSRVVSNSLYFREQDISPLIRLLPTVHEKIDVIHPLLTYLETKYYYRIPTSGPGKFENEFLKPFSSGTWLCIVVVSSLCALVLVLSAAFERRPSIVQYATFSVIASICQQFFQDVDENQSSRSSLARKIAILVTGISCVLTYNYYTSSVVSWLLNGPPPSINSLEELLESPLELIFEDVGYTRSWLQTSNYYYNKRNTKIEDALRQKKVFNKKKSDPLLVTVKEGIDMVKAGGYAYHTEPNNANAIISKTFTQSELCDIGSLQSMDKAQLYPCLQKNSPYKEFFMWSLMRLSERGVVSCIQRRTSFMEVKCEGSSPRALALGGAAPAFILLAAGCVLATVLMLIERWIYELKSRRTMKTSANSRKNCVN